MNSLIYNVKDFSKKSPYILVGAILFLICASFSLTRDDLVFLSVSQEFSYLDYWRYRYTLWSSRNIIEIILVFMVQHKLLWALINASLISLMCYCFSTLLYITDTKTKWLFSALALSFPMVNMSTAGWIATTTNYLWVASLGLFAITSITRIINQKPIKWYRMLTYLFATLYAGNQEQCAVILTCVFTCSIAYFLYKKLPIKCVTTLLITSLTSTIYHLIAPGNEARKIQETALYLPEFETWSTLVKFKIGFISTMYHYIVSPNRVLFVLIVLLILGVCTKCNSNKKYLLLVPLTSVVFMEFAIDRAFNCGLSEASILFKVTAYVLTFIIFICIPLSLYIIIGKKPKFLLALGIIGLGLGSRMILGFSPTVELSGSRTYLFMELAILLVSGMLYSILSPVLSKKKLQCLHLVFIAMASFSLLECLLQ